MKRSSENEVITHVKLKVGQHTTTSISRKYQNPTTPDFIIGKQTMNYSTQKPEGVDFKEEMKKLSTNASATWLFWELASRRNYKTNIAVLIAADLTTAELARVKSGYKALKEARLLVRTKQNHYLLNPHVFFPSDEHYSSVKDQWELITGEIL